LPLAYRGDPDPGFRERLKRHRRRRGSGTLAAMAAESDRDLDALWVVPPPQFVRARRALVARLRGAGRADAARAVERVRRPTLVVWAVNRMAREHPQTVRALVDATTALLRAQRRGAAELPDAIDHHRAVLRDAVATAEAVLRSERVATSAALVGRITGTLLGAAADADARTALANGRLTDEHRAPGFDALAGVQVAARVRPIGRTRSPSAPDPGVTGPRPSSSDDGAPPPEARPVDLARIAGARERLRQARAKAEEAARRAEDLARAEARQRAVADETRAAVAETRARLHDLEGRERDERRAVDRLARDAHRARRAARAAARAATGAERSLAAASGGRRRGGSSEHDGRGGAGAARATRRRRA
jgi:hypothetical protein